MQHQQEALQIFERLLDRRDPVIAITLNNLGALYVDLGRYREAEAAFKRAIEIHKANDEQTHPDYANLQNSLAELYRRQGRYAEAEVLFQRALSTFERIGPAGLDAGLVLNNLALNYQDQGRLDDAKSLLERSLQIAERTRGPEHPEIATRLNNVANIYAAQGGHTTARQFHSRSLAIRLAAFGSEHPLVAQSYANVANELTKLKAYSDAEAFYWKAVSITRKAYGDNHPSVAAILGQISQLYYYQDRYKDAEHAAHLSLAVRRKTLDPYHPLIARSASSLAVVQHRMGKHEEALTSIRAAVAIHRKRASRIAAQFSLGSAEELRSARETFLTQIEISAAADADLLPDYDVVSETFEAAQLASFTSTAFALSQAATRLAVGQGDLAVAIRERQEALGSFRRLDARLASIRGQPREKRRQEIVDSLRRERNTVETRLETLDKIMASEFPKYFELVSPLPLAATDAQSLLSRDEALIVYITDERATYAWIVTSEGASFLSFNISREALIDKVMVLRAALDQPDAGNLSDLRPYPLDIAYELYNKIFSPLVSQLEGISHVLLVLDGPLQSLPFGVLLSQLGTENAPARAGLAADLRQRGLVVVETTRRASSKPATEFVQYRHVTWLLEDYAFTVLPSVDTLRSLRESTQPSRASMPFIGFDNPVLDGRRSSSTGGVADLKTLYASVLIDKLI